MLDALDQVEPQARDRCVTAITRFRDAHGHVPVIVTATPESLEILPGFTRAAMSSPDPDDVRAALAHAGVDPAGRLYRAVDRDPEVMELLRSPLMLSILVPERPGTEEYRKYHELDIAAFVDRFLTWQLTERSPPLPYEFADMCRWLRFIARSRSEVFRPDDLDWAGVRNGSWFAWQQLIPVGVLAALGGYFGAQSEGSDVDWVDVVITVAIGAAVALWAGDKMALRPRLRVDWRHVFSPRAIGKGALTGMKIISTLTGAGIALLLAGAVYRYARGWLTGHPRSMHWWPAGAAPAQDLRQVAEVVVGVPAAGLFLGALCTIVGRGFRSAATTDQHTSAPRRVLRSAANGVTMMAVTWSFFLIMGIMGLLVDHDPITGWLTLGLVPSAGVGLYFGGFAALDRIGVRLHLYQCGDLPLRSGRFLSKISGRSIVIPHDGGYTFRHHLIRDCVSGLPDDGC
jgi:hypothetical protein